MQKAPEKSLPNSCPALHGDIGLSTLASHLLTSPQTHLALPRLRFLTLRGQKNLNGTYSKLMSIYSDVIKQLSSATQKVLQWGCRELGSIGRKTPTEPFQAAVFKAAACFNGHTARCKCMKIGIFERAESKFYSPPPHTLKSLPRCSQREHS